MAYTTTTRLGIKKAVPGSAQPFETAVFNENWDKVDDEFITTDARVDALEAGLDATNISQNTRLTAVETKNSEQDTRLNGIDSLNTTQNTRLTNIETLNTTQDGRLAAVEGVNTTQNSRLTALEGINAGTRLTAVETKNTTQDNRLAVLEINAGNPPLDFSVDGGTP